MRRTRLEAVGLGDVREYRTTDRTRIDDQRSTGDLCQTLPVAVPAQHDGTRHGRSEAFTDVLTRRRDQTFLVDVLGQERAVVRWGAVHGQDAFSELDGCRQRVLCTALLRRERCACKQVRGVQVCLVAIQQPAVVIPAHRWQPQCLKQFSGFERPERARNVIAEVDRSINAAAPNIRDDRFKREQIRVDIGNNS